MKAYRSSEVHLAGLNHEVRVEVTGPLVLGSRHLIVIYKRHLMNVLCVRIVGSNVQSYQTLYINWSIAIAYHFNFLHVKIDFCQLEPSLKTLRTQINADFA